MFAVIRVRGPIHVRRDIEDTLSHLRLNRVNHCVLVDDSPTVRGMLQKVKDYVTWGEIEAGTLAELLERRGRLVGNHPIDTVILGELGFEDFSGLAEAILEGRARLEAPIKPVMRLHPPVKGYEGLKKPFVMGGTLGYRGQHINDLIRRML
ncbi:MAG TPA: 50S ribosomal protein L30 [Thermoplasmata archaeon]|nr:50S ribosomal protein L30 [Thermoplasmata archaeon]